MPLGETKIGLMAAASGDSNYFGDGSDGAVTTSGNLTYTVSNTSGTYQGDMVVKNYTDFTISAGDTVVVDHNCSGLLIYCTGNCVINGNLQMNQRGSSLDSGWPADNPINGEDAIWMPMFTASAGSQSLTVDNASFTNCGSAATTAVANQPGISGNGSLFTIAGGSAGGGRSAAGNSTQTGGTGGGGTESSGTHEYWVMTGGGGGGGAQHESVGGAHSSSGGTGSPISGGSGGGGAGAYHGSASAGGVNNHTGQGGQGAVHHGHNNGAGGGAGQPGGGGASAGNGSGNTGSSGNGGIIWLIVGGNLTFGANAEIEAKGSNGGSGGGYKSGGGGGSGGGAAHIIYAGTLTDAGCSYTFTGGNGGGGGGSGGPGGTGGHLITQVSA